MGESKRESGRAREEWEGVGEREREEERERVGGTRERECGRTRERMWKRMENVHTDLDLSLIVYSISQN